MADDQNIQDTNIEETAQAPEAVVEENADKSTKFDFNVGDKVIINYRIVEGSKSRVQPYEGIVIGIKGGGISKTFTVRRMAAGNIGVERIFPIQSPNIESIKVRAKGSVRRAKLYYLRDRVGKAASKIKEK